MKKIIASLVLILCTTLGVVFTSPPANAGWFTEVYHNSADEGYNAPIWIKCHDGRTSYLLPGEGSPARCGARTDYIYVGTGQQISCQNLFPPFGWRLYDATGWHYIQGYTTLTCYMQLD